MTCDGFFYVAVYDAKMRDSLFFSFFSRKLD